jgi:hypothetical protein
LDPLAFALAAHVREMFRLAGIDRQIFRARVFAHDHTRINVDRALERFHFGPLTVSGHDSTDFGYLKIAWPKNIRERIGMGALRNSDWRRGKLTRQIQSQPTRFVNMEGYLEFLA